MFDKMCDYKRSSSKEDEEFFVNTSIITKRSLLPFIRGYPETHFPSCSVSYSKLYPRANIYYSFAEDMNPFKRLREFETLKSYISETDNFQVHFPPPENPFLKRDPYSESEAKIKYLDTEPACFVIFNKPGLNSIKLARMITNSWNCVLISPEIQMQEEIKKKSKTGEYIAGILKSGESVGQEIVMKLIEERISQRDVKHRGYVIEGFPLIPSNSDLDDASYSNHVDIAEGTDDQEFNTHTSSKHYSSSSIMSFVECEEENGLEYSQDSFDDITNINRKVCQCYECDISKQLNDMFNLWPLKPHIIIYMVCPEPDFLYKRSQFVWDPHSGKVVDKTIDIIGDSHESDPESDVEVIETYENILKGEIFNESVEKHFVKRIADMTPNIDFQNEIFKRHALPIIEKLILKHNPQNVIRVDGRTTVERMFDIVRLKLRLLPLPRVIMPVKLSEPVNFEIRGEDLLLDPNQNFEGKTKEQISEELSYRGAVSPRFRWRLSDWKFLCPVELATGRRVEGDVKYAIRFMNCLYFLSSEKAADSFIENPRPYLLPPNPKPTCKIAVIGPRYSGKTELSNKLALYLGGTVIDIQRIENDYIDEKIQEKIATAVRENLDAVIRDATKILQKEREDRESRRLAELKSWSFQIRKMLDHLKMLKESPEKSLETSEEIEHIRQTLQQSNIQFLEDDEDLQIINQDESMIVAYAPDYLKLEEEPVPELTEHDPQVAIMLEDRVKFLRESPFIISPEDKVEIILRSIETVPSTLIGEITRDSGWILDNMSLDLAIWKGLIESGLEIDNIIVLFEEEPYNHLTRKWNSFNDYEDDYEYIDELIISEAELNYMNEGNEEIFPKISEIKTLSEYIKTIREYEKSLKVFRNTLKELGKEALFYNLKEIDSFEFICGYLSKEFQPTAHKMSKKEKEVESRDLGVFSSKPLDEFEGEREEEIAGEEEEDEISASKQISFLDNRRLGDTNSYCPVALVRHGVFWKGQENLSAILANKIYFLSNARALEEFVQNSSQFFLPWKEPLCKIPPLRLCIVGSPGSGKSTMARALSKECGLVHVDFFDKVDDFMLQLGFESVNWKQDSIIARDGEIPGEIDEDELEDLAADNEEELEDLKVDDEDELEDLKADDQIAGNQIMRDMKSEIEKDANFDKDTFMIDKGVMVSTVRNYKERGDILPDIMLKEILFKYFKPPFDKCGVILDSFPNCTQDVELILKKYAVPEIIIELKCNLQLAQERLLPVLLESWKAKQDQKKLEEQKRYETELGEFNDRKEIWIKEKLRERRKRRQRADTFEGQDNFSDFNVDNIVHTPPPSLASGNVEETVLSEKSVTYIKLRNLSSDLDLDFDFDPYPQQTAADRIELENLYLEKNPEPTIFSNWEEERSAKRRIIKYIKEAYKLSYNRLKKTRHRMKNESIPWIEIDSQIGAVKVFCNLLAILDSYLHRNSSIFERSYEISMDVAEMLLDCGYYFLSSFGRYCPVQMYERKVPFHMFLSLESLDQIIPVLHRQYIYFLSGKEALELFKKDPLKYLNQDSSSPLIPVQISIIGPPKCGKTTLAQRFARTYGFKIITRGQSLRHTLEKISRTDLALSMENNLRKGNFVTDEQIARAVDIYALDPRSSLGFILDGFPVCPVEAEELVLLGIKPMIILDLKANIDFCSECIASISDDIRKPSVFSSEFLMHQYQCWKDGEKQFRDWLYGFGVNIVKIDATRNKWGVWIRADEIVRLQFSAIKKYFREVDFDKVHHLEYLCISPYEFRKRESIYQNFCPVCIHHDILKSSCISLDCKGIFQFQHHFYWVCPEHVEVFAEDPLNNLKKEMPVDLPQILDGAIDLESSCWTRKLISGGYCIVTYVESLPYCKMVAGKPDLALVYKDRLYLFCTMECRNRFMAQSSNYFDVEIHFQRTLPPIQVKNLPNLGFLEQTVASLIIKAVHYVGILRPKLPGHSASTAAAIYLGAYLKTHNFTSDLNEIAIYEKVMKRMKLKSEFLRSITQNMKNKVNPFVTLNIEERKRRSKIKSVEIERIAEIAASDKSVINLSRSSITSRHNGSVKFRRTSPTQILTDTESVFSLKTSI